MKNENENPKTPWWQPGVLLFVRLSSWIAGPVVIAVLVGNWVEKKYHTKPWVFLAIVAGAFVISIFGIVRNAREEMGKIK